ncbi:hypothetical protein HRG_009593 [Hirsutella rhossiliensis]|uniref:Uncharacterized protein n=1 Tax=Hirsutella rhossiliensis TaxID=111463 RepID=A0A9P8MPN1_9HYPO|nr:uncharacterized protein HRG_09593 [Hirsutella rhossiliensis]KAH0959132.1 hypothetical protein HRG_09593 [Hirsutella rhossiliensis]
MMTGRGGGKEPGGNRPKRAASPGSPPSGEQSEAKRAKLAHDSPASPAPASADADDHAQQPQQQDPHHFYAQEPWMPDFFAPVNAPSGSGSYNIGGDGDGGADDSVEGALQLALGGGVDDFDAVFGDLVDLDGAAAAAAASTSSHTQPASPYASAFSSSPTSHGAVAGQQQRFQGQAPIQHQQQQQIPEQAPTQQLQHQSQQPVQQQPALHLPAQPMQRPAPPQQQLHLPAQPVQQQFHVAPQQLLLSAQPDQQPAPQQQQLHLSPQQLLLSAQPAQQPAPQQPAPQQQLQLSPQQPLLPAQPVQQPAPQQPAPVAAQQPQQPDNSTLTGEQVVQAAYGNGVRIDSVLCRRLAGEPAQREPVQRRAAQRLNIERRSNVEALLAHVTGQVAAQPCKNCHKGHGPWTQCVVYDGQMCGSCSNCWFNASGSRCTFHENNNPQPQQHMHQQQQQPLPATPQHPAPVQQQLPQQQLQQLANPYQQPAQQQQQHVHPYQQHLPHQQQQLVNPYQQQPLQHQQQQLVSPYQQQPLQYHPAVAATASPTPSSHYRHRRSQGPAHFANGVNLSHLSANDIAQWRLADAARRAVARGMDSTRIVSRRLRLIARIEAAAEELGMRITEYDEYARSPEGIAEGDGSVSSDVAAQQQHDDDDNASVGQYEPPPHRSPSPPSHHSHDRVHEDA